MTSVTAPAYSAIAGAISGVITWALSTYAFHGAVPQPVQVALYVLIPALVTGVASLVTKNYTVIAAAKAVTRNKEVISADITSSNTKEVISTDNSSSRPVTVPVPVVQSPKHARGTAEDGGG